MGTVCVADSVAVDVPKVTVPDPGIEGVLAGAEEGFKRGAFNAEVFVGRVESDKVKRNFRPEVFDHPVHSVVNILVRIVEFGDEQLTDLEVAI